MIIGELSPWDTIKDYEYDPRRDSPNTNIEVLKHKRASVSFTPPVAARYLNTTHKTSSIAESSSVGKESLVNSRRKRLSLNDSSKVRGETEDILLLPVISNQYPLGVESTAVFSPGERKKKIQSPEIGFLEALIQSQKRYVKLKQLMPELQLYSNNKKKSRSLLTLHSLRTKTRMFTPAKDEITGPQDPLRIDQRVQDIIQRLPKKQGKLRRTLYHPSPECVPHQTIRLMKFENKPKMSPIKPLNKTRAQHFLDKFFEKLC